MVCAGRLFGLPVALVGKSVARIDTRSAGKGGDFGKYPFAARVGRLRRYTRQEVPLGNEAFGARRSRRTLADLLGVISQKAVSGKCPIWRQRVSGRHFRGSIVYASA
jgi:hypothetical protein